MMTAIARYVDFYYIDNCMHCWWDVFCIEYTDNYNLLMIYRGGMVDTHVYPTPMHSLYGVNVRTLIP